MRKIFPLILVVLFSCGSAYAQTFIGGGASVTRSTSYAPPNGAPNGGATFQGFYAEGAYDMRNGLQARFFAEYLKEATLPSIFSYDEETGRKATKEFNFSPALRLRFGNSTTVRPFIEGGVKYVKQQFVKAENEPDKEYGKYPQNERKLGDPEAGLNPFARFGIEFGKTHEASFTRYFVDPTNFNNSKLNGYGANYSFSPKMFKGVALIVGAQADYVIFRESNGQHTDNYFEKDFVAKGFLGFRFGRTR